MGPQTPEDGGTLALLHNHNQHQQLGFFQQLNQYPGYVMANGQNFGQPIMYTGTSSVAIMFSCPLCLLVGRLADW